MANQYFKTVYYCDHPAESTNAKTLTIAFNAAELPLFQKIKGLSSLEIRELTGIDSYQQLLIIAQNEERSANNVIKRRIKKNITVQEKIKSEDCTFKKSKIIPFQRWYPYIEGYSPDYVQALIQNYALTGARVVYDPFAGTGTTIFGAGEFNIHTVFSEINPLLQFIIETKISILTSSLTVRQQLSNNLRETAERFNTIFEDCKEDEDLKKSYKALFGNSEYFESAVYKNILQLRAYIDKLKLTDALLADSITIAVLSALIPVSLLKKQGDVRFKTAEELRREKITLAGFLPKKLFDMADDVINLSWNITDRPEFIISNAKNIGLVRDIKIDAVITSPPYLNGTNYFRNTKLELWFLRHIQFDGDLRCLRNQALTSGINDVKRSSSACIDNDILSKAEY